MKKTLENNLSESSFTLLRKLENCGDSVLYFRSCNFMNPEILNKIKECGEFRQSWYDIGKSLDEKYSVKEVDYEILG